LVTITTSITLRLIGKFLNGISTFAAQSARRARTARTCASNAIGRIPIDMRNLRVDQPGADLQDSLFHLPPCGARVRRVYRSFSDSPEYNIEQVLILLLSDLGRRRSNSSNPCDNSPYRSVDFASESSEYIGVPHFGGVLVSTLQIRQRR